MSLNGWLHAMWVYDNRWKKSFLQTETNWNSVHTDRNKLGLNCKYNFIYSSDKCYMVTKILQSLKVIQTHMFRETNPKGLGTLQFFI